MLSRAAGTDFETLKQLNPALRRGQTPPGTTTTLRVPRGAGAATVAGLALVPPSERVLYVRHLVRRGDTLSALSDRYGVSVAMIQQANRMGRHTMIHVGQELTIPTAGGGAAAASSAREPLRAPAPAPEVVDGEPLTYRVRHGDTLTGIARRYGTTAAAIAAASGVQLHTTLWVGQSLTVVPGARSTAAASAVLGRGAENGNPTPAAPVVTSHTVQRGETLTSIAELHGTTAEAVARLNGRSVHQVLHVGDELRIVPGARTHTVRRGENLWNIAQRYATTVEQICALNDIPRDAPLRPGTRLTVTGE